MIIELYIRNFALIEEARISFGPGLTILTGETGAGKSIVLDAIALLMGGRASSDFVRQGTERATLEAVFSVNTESIIGASQLISSEQSMQKVLEEAGIEWSSEGTLVIARDLMLNGKTVSRINGRIVTVNLLKQVAPFLLDMAGQHENQSLLRPDEHLQMIDVFGGAPIAELRRTVADCFEGYQQIKKQLQNAQVGEQERAIRIDMLRFQLQEIDAAGLKPDEDGDLEQERRRLAHAEKLFSMSNSLYTGLYEGEGHTPAVLDGLATLINELESALKVDSSLQSCFDMLNSAQVQIEEVAHEMRAYRDNIEFNPNRLSQLEDRLAAISKLKRKYGQTAEDILAYGEKIRTELTNLENHEERMEDLQKELRKKSIVLAQACRKLSEVRQAVAKQVSEQIMATLGQLMMPKTQIAVKFDYLPDPDGLLLGDQTVHVSERGVDHAEFLFSPNPGEPMRPLSRIASGGELSRMLLACKSILADSSGVQTLVFDEVDTGISGQAAQAVAERMSALAKGVQVLVVTHLPQVACMGDTHLQIYKVQSDGRVNTYVETLTEQERIEALARMMSGAELTDASRRAAEEMLRLARLLKAS